MSLGTELKREVLVGSQEEKLEVWRLLESSSKNKMAELISKIEIHRKAVPLFPDFDSVAVVR